MVLRAAPRKAVASNAAESVKQHVIVILVYKALTPLALTVAAEGTAPYKRFRQHP
jgi:hypothetical protein